MAAPKRCCSCGPPTSVKTIVSALIGHDHAAPPELPAPAVSGPRRERRNGNAPYRQVGSGSCHARGSLYGASAALSVAAFVSVFCALASAFAISLSASQGDNRWIH